MESARAVRYALRVLLASILAASLLPPPAPPLVRFVEDFSSYPESACLPDGSKLGPWTVVFSGYGCVKIASEGGNKLLHTGAPQSEADQTRALLIAGPDFSAPLTFTSRVATVSQARSGSPANPWEVGWIAWGYTDNEHFYYFIPKPNGWELGKRDPAYPGGQRFLITGRTPYFPVGSWTTLRIAQDADNAITVHANDELLIKFADSEKPYLSGRIALYNEDAHARFDDIMVSAGSGRP